MLQLARNDLLACKYIIFPTKRMLLNLNDYTPLICIEATKSNCSSWKIGCDGGSALSKYNDYFVIEPLPSSRDSEFFEEFRYESVEEARNRFNEWLTTGEAEQFIYNRYRINLNDTEAF